MKCPIYKTIVIIGCLAIVLLVAIGSFINSKGISEGILAITAVIILWYAKETSEIRKTEESIAGLTYKSIQAQLLSDILDQYSKQEMLEAFELWKQFVSDFNKDHVSEFIKRKKEGGRLYEVLNPLRRKISHFFMKIARLYDKNLIGEEVVDSVAHLDKIKFWTYIIEPIEKAINPEYNDHDFKVLKKYHNRSQIHFPNLDCPAINESAKYIECLLN